jgi:hypothetical protein
MDIDHFGYGLIWIWKMELYIIFRSLNPKRTNPQVAAPPVPVCFFRLHGLQVIPVLPVHIPGSFVHGVAGHALQKSDGLGANLGFGEDHPMVTPQLLNNWSTGCNMM